MATSNLSNQGPLVWFGSPIQPSSGVGSNLDFTGLTACSIVTGTDTISLEVIKNNIVVAHFAIANIVAWNVDITNFSITFDCADKVDYTFYFISKAEALEADNRTNQIVNGANLLSDCGPEQPLIRFNDFFFGALTSDLLTNGSSFFKPLSRSIDGVCLYGLVDIAGTFNRARFVFKDSTNTRPPFYTPSQMIFNHSVFLQSVPASMVTTNAYDTLYMQISNNEINWFDMIDPSYTYLERINGVYTDSGSSTTRIQGTFSTSNVAGAFQGGDYYMNNLFLKMYPTAIINGDDFQTTFSLIGTLNITNPTNLDIAGGAGSNLSFDQNINVPNNLYLATRPVLFIPSTGETIDLGEKMKIHYGPIGTMLGVFCVNVDFDPGGAFDSGFESGFEI